MPENFGGVVEIRGQQQATAAIGSVKGRLSEAEVAARDFGRAAKEAMGAVEADAKRAAKEQAAATRAAAVEQARAARQAAKEQATAAREASAAARQASRETAAAAREAAREQAAAAREAAAEIEENARAEIIAAVAAGASLREVAEVAGISHTAVKFIAHGRPPRAT